MDTEQFMRSHKPLHPFDTRYFDLKRQKFNYMTKLQMKVI